MAAAALLVGAAGVSAQTALPEQSITENTAAVVVIDAEQITADDLRASAERINALLPADVAAPQEQMQAELDESLAEFTKIRETFSNSGGEAVVIVVPAPPTDEAAAVQEPAMFIRVREGTTPEQMAEALNAVRPEGEEPVELVAYEGQWLLSAEHAATVTRDGEPAQAQAFKEILERAEEAPITVAFRSTASFREAAAAAQDNPAAAGPFAAFAGPAESFEYGWTTINFGQSPELTTALTFADAQAAQQFNAGWNSLLMMGQGFLSAQLAQVPEAPHPETVQALFQTLAMKQEDNTVRLELGEQFVQQLAQVAPALAEPLMGMMGGMRQQPMMDDPMMEEEMGEPMWDDPGMEEPADEQPEETPAQ